ncbi:MAG: outer membrane protein [Hyphomicrobium sp.]
MSLRTNSSLLAAVALLMPALAQAADLGRGPAVSPEPYEYHEPAQFGRWNGFYLGLTYGYAGGWTDVSSGGSSFDIDTEGGNGSLFAGYNWQFGRIVTGLEADIGIGDLGGNENGISTDLNSLGSVRGRLGYLVTPNFMLFGTAGFAYADIDFSGRGDTVSETLTGYQVGGGTELKFSDPWSLKLEYVYTDLDPETVDLGGVGHTFEPDFHTVRAG